MKLFTLIVKFMASGSEVQALGRANMATYWKCININIFHCKLSLGHIKLNMFYFKKNPEYCMLLAIYCKSLQISFYHKFTIAGPWSYSKDNPIFLRLLRTPLSLLWIDVCKHQIIKAGAIVRGVSDYGLDFNIKLK